MHERRRRPNMLSFCFFAVFISQCQSVQHHLFFPYAYDEIIGERFDSFLHHCNKWGAFGESTCTSISRGTGEGIILTLEGPSRDVEISVAKVSIECLQVVGFPTLCQNCSPSQCCPSKTEPSWKEAWEEMSSEQQVFWYKLGEYDHKWDGGWFETKPVISKCFDDLDQEERNAAESLCFDQNIWDELMYLGYEMNCGEKKLPEKKGFSPTFSPTKVSIVSLILDINGLTPGNALDVCFSVANALDGEVKICSLKRPSKRRRLRNRGLYMDVLVHDIDASEIQVENDGFVASLKHLPEGISVTGALLAMENERQETFDRDDLDLKAMITYGSAFLAIIAFLTIGGFLMGDSTDTNQEIFLQEKKFKAPRASILDVRHMDVAFLESMVAQNMAFQNNAPSVGGTTSPI